MKWKILVPSDFETTDVSYRIAGREYYRVTHVLSVVSKDQLQSWLAKVGQKQANQIIETRQVIGTHVHKLIELHLQGKKVNLGTYETEIREGMCKFYEFSKHAELKAEALEQRLWSNTYGYAGTADYIGNYVSPTKFLVRGHEAKFPNKSFVVGDWKTSKDIYPQYWMQIAAYCYAFKELTGITPDGGFICRIRNGTIRVKEKTWPELALEYKAFLAALEIHKWKYRLGEYENLYR
jgi:hypothetical protein